MLITKRGRGILVYYNSNFLLICIIDKYGIVGCRQIITNMGHGFNIPEKKKIAWMISSEVFLDLLYMSCTSHVLSGEQGEGEIFDVDGLPIQQVNQSRNGVSVGVGWIKPTQSDWLQTSTCIILHLQKRF